MNEKMSALELFQEAQKAIQCVEPEWEKAFELYLKAAEKGHAEAALEVGLCFLYGFGTHAVVEKALFWFQQAAKMGQPAGLYEIASIYRDCMYIPVNPECEKKFGQMFLQEAEKPEFANDPRILVRKAQSLIDSNYVDRDLEEAIRILEPLAAAGCVEAQIELAFLYVREQMPTPSEEILGWIKALAERGNIWGQYLFGVFLFRGVGCEEDPENGVVWLKRAAVRFDRAVQYLAIVLSCLDGGGDEALECVNVLEEHGCLLAKNVLGIIYLKGFYLKDIYSNGMNVNVDLGLARKYLREMMELGMLSAQLHLAESYYNVPESEQDFNEAFRLAQSLADKNYTSGKLFLAKLFQEGKGTKRDLRKAYEIFHELAEKNERIAYFSVGQCLRFGLGVEQNLEEAITWFKKGVKYNIGEVQNALGECFRDGTHVEVDFAEAVRLFQLAIKQKNVKALENLALCELEGLGIQKDPDKAKMHLMQAYMLGSCESAWFLGCAFRDGKLEQKNLVRAVTWFKIAAKSGHLEALNALGCLLMTGGARLKSDPAEGANCFWKAAKNGYFPAQVNLALCFEYGEGTEIDLRAAELWFQKAAEQHSEEIRPFLEELHSSDRPLSRHFSGEWQM